jgi:alanyl-tRNA synthetase
LNSNGIRSAYLKYFEEKGHLVIPSSSLVPYKDPTLLFTNAGMIQIEPYYRGVETPPNPRLASCQKCFRTNDVESVGDTKHLTFFEMLGNFSVGDYFKNEAIAWAWEFVIERLKLPKERLWITVYTDDDEAYAIWNKKIGVPAERIMRFGEKDNFWGPAGASGPCGPCSELHYDFGEGTGCGQADCNPSCGCSRFVEVWNLVFTQFNQDVNKVRTLLPKPNIDTGMGLERLTTVMQGKSSVYETDIFKPLLDKLSVISGKIYGQNAESDNSMRVIVEHSRAIAFVIADGVMPANDGRGYVLRRLLRRAALFGKRLGMEQLFLKETCAAAIDHMQDIYPELARGREMILKVVEVEESRFHETLNTGLNMLDELVSKAASQVRNKIAGDQAFKLYDTYGFPVELTREIVARAGLSVDMDGFEKEMEKQKERARASHKFDVSKGSGKIEFRAAVSKTQFVGYQQTKTQAKIVDIVVDNRSVASLTADQEAGLILDVTPFYGEMGGQAGDSGLIESGSGKFKVANTIHLGDYVLHLGRMESGQFRYDKEVEATVDSQRRSEIAANHSATHLLQYALRQVLGTHVQQRGSQVGAEGFRFDFSHLTAMNAEEILKVQQIVNARIRENLVVNTAQMAYKEAVGEGATALFDEKYGDVVRVVKIGLPVISAELCGGTHASATGQIGFFQIVAESSIGSGLRRIEAVSGKGAEKYVEQSSASLAKIAQALGAPAAGAQEKVSAVLAELDEKSKKLSNLEKELSRKSAADISSQAVTINGVKVLAAKVEGVKIESLREMADVLKQKLGSGIIVLGSVFEDRPSFIAMVTPDLVEKGYSAGDIVKKVAQVTGGGGGGKPGMAQAGGKDKTKIDEAIQLVKTLIK